MMKFVDKIFGSPHFLGELLFAGKYAALLQFFVALFFCGLSRFGGPLGSLECAQVLSEAGLVTLTLTLATEIIGGFLCRMGTEL